MNKINNKIVSNTLISIYLKQEHSLEALRMMNFSAENKKNKKINILNKIIKNLNKK